MQTAREQPLNVLVVHGDVPPPDRDACSLRLFRVVELLAAEGHRVTFLARGGFGQERNSAMLLRMGVAEVIPFDIERFAEFRPQTGVRYNIAPIDLEALLRRGRFDVAWLSLYDVAEQYTPLLRELSPATRIVVDSTDVHWVREHRGALLDGDARAISAAERTRERERAVYAAADALVAVSDVDADAMRELAPDVPVGVVSLVHSFPSVSADPEGREGLLFVGNFHHIPNVDAVTDFCASTWPLVRRRLPGVQLTLVGTGPPAEVQALAAPDVAVTGWVPSVDPYLDRARISIAPLRYGAGVKGKIGEAIAAGVPVVTTTIGAEGMGFVDGEHVLVADEPEAFADAIVRLYHDEDLWRRLASQAPVHAAARLGPEAARAAIRGVLAGAAPARWQAPAGAEWLREVLSAYAQEFAPGDAATLLLTVPPGDPQAPAAAYERVVASLAQAGLDPDAMADIEITAWDERVPLPGRTAVFDAPDAVGRDRGVSVRRRHEARVALAVQTCTHVPTVAAQLQSLQRLGLGPDVELVIVARTVDAEMAELLADGHGARLVRCDGPPGRAITQSLALEASTAPVLVTLGPLALPQPGFLEPLVDAVAAGASLAGAVIDGAHGLRVAGDGSLWPRAGDEPGTIDALALDCLAARREVWTQAPPVLSAREGHPEHQLARWAIAHGRLAAPGAAVVRRADAGPVSAIICTRNRAEELPDAVALLAAHGVTSGGGEVIIVDNGSTDATAEVAARLAASHPGVRVVLEEQAGLSHARNAGAAAARNELLCYLDDDARPAPGWRESMAWALTRPGVAAAGGPICALWPPERTEGWPAPGLEGLLSVLDGGDRERVLVPPEIAYGANWAIRASALRAAGGFDAHLGYSPDVRIGSEEVAVAWRLHLRGIGSTIYAPGAAVGHRISEDRLRDSYLVERAFAVGIEHAHLRAEREGLGHDRMLAEASQAAAAVLRVPGLEGDLTLEEAFARTQQAPIPVPSRTTASEALGLLAATVLLLGEREVAVEGLHLRLRPEHLRGVLGAVGEAGAVAEAA